MSVTVHNAFKNFYYEVGQTEFDISTSAKDTAIFDNFPLYPPGSTNTTDETGFYNIVVDAGKITFDLIGNEGASSTNYEAGTFDTYYFEFPTDVDASKYQVIRSDNYNVTVEYVMKDDDIVPTAPPLNVKPSFSNGALRVRFGEGTDMNTIGQKIVVAYGSAVDVSLVSVWNTFAKEGLPGEQYWDVDYDLVINTRGIGATLYDFPSRPPQEDGTPRDGGFYDVTIDDSTITFKLKTNDGASDILFPAQSFDRYYFVFPEDLGVTSGVATKTANYQVTVSTVDAGTDVAWGSILNPSAEKPAKLSKGALKVEFGPGSDLTEIGQEIVITYERGAATAGDAGHIVVSKSMALIPVLASFLLRA